ncbi:hypothetical protein FOA52_005992 [Chlamydomonas sp. UWO 241]|nr:hypothetical protein FOA52_005992 [Chlamydomonas sp. UWO 241]
MDHKSRVLFASAACGATDGVVSALRGGANANAQDGTGMTPLCRAAHSGNLAMVQLLRDSGGDIHKADHWGRTPLRAAAGKGHALVITYLAACGANVDAADSAGWSPLFAAAHAGHADTVRALLEHGADVNRQHSAMLVADDGGHLQRASPREELCDALWAARCCGHAGVIQHLIAHGASAAPPSAGPQLTHHTVHMPVVQQQQQQQVAQVAQAAQAAQELLKSDAPCPVAVRNAVALGTAASTLLYSGNALAAQEMVATAAGDSRVSTLGLLLLPALGWVGFNILGGLNSQLGRMADMKEDAAPSVAGAVGLGAAASMLFAQNADAAAELSQLAASDSRVSVLATLFVPALGWVGFNILGGLNNQLGRMADMKDDAKPSVAGAVGLGAAASMLFAQNADAATELSQLAASDSRVAVLATLFVPALGWVGFNILGGLNNQLGRMSDMKDDAKPSVAGAVGLGAAASMLFAQNADAATELSQLAASDSRGLVLLTLFVPAIGWVAFNILAGLNNQLDRMSDMKDDAKP